MIYEIRKYSSKSNYYGEACSDRIVYETNNGMFGISGKLINFYIKSSKREIPEGIKIIGKEVFGGGGECDIFGNEISELVLPESLEEIELGAFTSNDYIKKITCKSKNFIINNGGLYSLDGKILHYIIKPTLKDYETFKVPEGVEIIAGGNNYCELIIPSSVKMICGELYNTEIYAPKDSYAIKYAKQKGIKHYEVEYKDAVALVEENWNR